MANDNEYRELNQMRALITAGKIKRTCLKAQFQRIMRHMQMQPQRGISSHHSE